MPLQNLNAWKLPVTVRMRTTTAALFAALCFTGPITADRFIGADEAPLYQGARFSTKDLAETWNLTEDEIERYQRLRATEDAYGAPNRPPYEVLGKHARNAEELRYYAGLTVRAEIEQKTLTLNWISAIDAATPKPNKLALDLYDAAPEMQAFFQREQGITRENYVRSIRQEELGTVEAPDKDTYQMPTFLQNAGDMERAVIYVDVEQPCSEACEAVWERVNGLIDEGDVAGIDVVAMNADGAPVSSESIFGWASGRGITREQNSAGEVTLNKEDDDWRRMLAGRRTPIAIGSQSGAIIE